MKTDHKMNEHKPTVITIEDLKIDYRNLNHFSIQQIIKNPALKGGNVLHAIRGISLEIKEGEVLGIVGANGAGKSTLLKAIAGIFQPDEGKIDTNGKRVSLMSLGVGFKWELTGRENIMIAGLLLRYKESYIKEKMDEIIAFSELEDAIDHPVRTYSSGMYSKLSFAITAILETDIMLVDELLSVGDERFQKKSYDKIQSLVHQEHMTSLIVSHDMELIKRSCTRVIWMHKGLIIASGTPEEIIPMYVRWSRIMGAPKLKQYDDFNSLLTGDCPEEDLIAKNAMFRGIMVDEDSGLLVNPGPHDRLPDPCSIAVNWEPVFIGKGSVLRKKEGDLECRLFFYDPEIPKEFIYIPLTSTEGNVAGYAGDLMFPDDAVWISDKDRYIRVCVKDRSGSALPVNAFFDDYFELEDHNLNDRIPEFLSDEIKAVTERVRSERRENDPVFLLLSDSHMAVGGNWNDTAFSLKALARELSLDAIIHMGDLIDGQCPEAVSLKQVRGMISDMESTGVPVYICPGNHDLDVLSSKSILNLDETWHYADLDSHKIRLIFLSGYDPARMDQYGYSDEELLSVERLLKELPEDYGAMLFSHTSPQRMKTKYGEPIHNAGKLMQILGKYEKKVLGVFYGHEHEDLVTDSYSFPVIGQSCSKLEDCKKEKPLHSGVISRRPGEASQELFDVVIVKRELKETVLIRFGAGEDRRVRK